jgi:hypothetical protein
MALHGSFLGTDLGVDRPETSVRVRVGPGQILMRDDPNLNPDLRTNALEELEDFASSSMWIGLVRATARFLMTLMPGPSSRSHGITDARAGTRSRSL